MKSEITGGELADVTARLRTFSSERGWEEFHDLKSLAMAIASEAGDLLSELNAANYPVIASRGKPERPVLPGNDRR